MHYINAYMHYVHALCVKDYCFTWLIVSEPVSCWGCSFLQPLHMKIWKVSHEMISHEMSNINIECKLSKQTATLWWRVYQGVTNPAVIICTARKVTLNDHFIQFYEFNLVFVFFKYCKNTHFEGKNGRTKQVPLYRKRRILWSKGY